MTDLLPVLLLAGILPFGGGDDAAPFPVEARGDIHFHLDAARFRVDGQAQPLVYLSIPQTELTESPDSSGLAHLAIDVDFEDADGDRITTHHEESWVPVAAGSSGGEYLQPRWLLVRRPGMPQETQQMMVRLTDLDNPKRGLLDRIRGRKPSGQARGRFSAEPLACGLSEITFGEEVEAAGHDSGILFHGRMCPNPLRYFGLYRTTLLLYIERYGEAAPVAYEIYQTADSSLVASGIDSTGASEEGAHPVFIGADVSSFPAGTYRVEVWKVGRENCRTGADFQVLWDMASWTRDQADLLAEAYVLLGPVEYEEVREMSPGEAEAYLHELWNRHDPDLTTGRNELRDLFEERVAHANTFFGTSFRKGMMTDRGRVYVRYGPPDEIEKELNPQDVDLIANVLPGEVASDQFDIIRNPMTRDSRDNRAYEIWYYQVRGAPLFPEQQNPVQRTGLKFIFVDELGYGDMRLVYTNLSGAF